jgi:3-oxoacyl-[acyl-carrier protein] reductase
MFDLTGKCALVTGASGGIGAAMATRLHEAGATVGLSGTREAPLKDWPRPGRAGPCAALQPGRCGGGRRAAETGSRGDGRGRYPGQQRRRHARQPLHADVGRGMGAGHRDQPDGVHAALPGRAARHDEGALGPDRERDLGRGATGNPGQGNYAASKAGLVGMSKSLAYEVASRGITVNCIAPGFIETAMTDKLTDDQKGKILGQIPAGRMGRPTRSRRRHSTWPAPRRPMSPARRCT